MNRSPYVKAPNPPQRKPRPQGPAPVVIGTVSHDGRSVTVRCPWCRKDHVHGAPDPAPEGSSMKVVGLRLSHCTDREPGSYRIIGRLAT